MRSRKPAVRHDLLRGRVAVVTGSSRGLGYAMARELGLHGAAVVLAARSDDAVAAAVERLRAEGIAASGRHCDTGDLADVEAVRDEALARGTLDIWINNAGTSGVFGGCSGIPVPDQADAGDARTAQRAARPPPPEQQDATGRHRGGRTPGRLTNLRDSRLCRGGGVLCQGSLGPGQEDQGQHCDDAAKDEVERDHR